MDYDDAANDAYDGRRRAAVLPPVEAPLLASRPRSAGEYVLHVVAVSSFTAKGVNNFAIMGLHQNFAARIKNVPADLTCSPANSFRSPRCQSAVSTSSFFLTRILPSDRPRQLELSFFDLGDDSIGASNGTLTLETQGVSTGFANGTDQHVATFVSMGAATCDSDSTTQRTISAPSVAFGDTPRRQLQGRLRQQLRPEPTASGADLGRALGDAASSTCRRVAATDGFNCISTSVQNCWINGARSIRRVVELSDATAWSAHIRAVRSGSSARAGARTAGVVLRDVPWPARVDVREVGPRDGLQNEETVPVCASGCG